MLLCLIRFFLSRLKTQFSVRLSVLISDMFNFVYSQELLQQESNAHNVFYKQYYKTMHIIILFRVRPPARKLQYVIITHFLTIHCSIVFTAEVGLRSVLPYVAYMYTDLIPSFLWQAVLIPLTVVTVDRCQ